MVNNGNIEGRTSTDVSSGVGWMKRKQMCDLKNRHRECRRRNEEVKERELYPPPLLVVQTER